MALGAFCSIPFGENIETADSGEKTFFFQQPTNKTSWDTHFPLSSIPSVALAGQELCCCTCIDEKTVPYSFLIQILALL